jgi:hypothetical protein
MALIKNICYNKNANWNIIVLICFFYLPLFSQDFNGGSLGEVELSVLKSKVYPVKTYRVKKIINEIRTESELIELENNIDFKILNSLSFVFTEIKTRIALKVLSCFISPIALMIEIKLMY